jgi:hypothetical protein
MPRRMGDLPFPYAADHNCAVFCPQRSEVTYLVARRTDRTLRETAA